MFSSGGFHVPIPVAAGSLPDITVEKSAVDKLAVEELRALASLGFDTRVTGEGASGKASRAFGAAVWATEPTGRIVTKRIVTNRMSNHETSAICP